MTDVKLTAPEKQIAFLEKELISIAREIAIDILPLEKVLEINSISPEEWADLQRNTRFMQLLEGEIAAFRGALNTSDRVKMKSAAAIEEWLPELYARINDPKEPLNAKIEGAKLLARLGGVGEKAIDASSGERVSITINMGNSAPVSVSAVTTKVIDGELLGEA